MTGNATLPAGGIDPAAVRSALGATGEGPLADLAMSSVAVLGGSLADGLCDGRSDIDVYIAVDQPPDGAAVERLADRLVTLLPGSFRVPVTFPYAHIHATQRATDGTSPDGVIDITVFDAGQLLGQASVLRDQCLANSAGPLFGHPPTALLRALHALNGGHVLWGEQRLETLQTRIGSDLYPLLMLLYALDRALRAWRDLRTGAGTDPVAPADASQRFAQAVADAVLAWFGRPNPDDRWRLACLRLLETEQPGLLPWDRFYDALLLGQHDDPSPEPAVEALRMLLHSPLIGTYPQAKQLSRSIMDGPGKVAAP